MPSSNKELPSGLPGRAAGIVGLTEEAIVKLAREYATTKPAVIRINYGMQRHEGGGMAVRTVACLPALVGAWRHASGGILLSTGGTYEINLQRLQRPDLIWNNPRTVNMSALGDALLGQTRSVRWHRGEDANATRRLEQIQTPLDPPIKAIYVYNARIRLRLPLSRKR